MTFLEIRISEFQHSEGTYLIKIFSAIHVLNNLPVNQSEDDIVLQKCSPGNYDV